VQRTLFEQLGGFAKIRLIVSDFYDRALDSPTLAPYFSGIDMRRLVDHQTKFVASVTGGPASYSDEHIGRAHAHLHVRAVDFDEMAIVLRETLEDNGVADADVARIIGQVARMRSRIVSDPVDALQGVS
jgi:hemoglobin